MADLFLKGMEENKLPWQKPWNPGEQVSDYNLFTMAKNNKPVRYYKGMNGLICELTRIMEMESEDPRWCTALQLKEYNKQQNNVKDQMFIKKGEHGLPIKFYTRLYYDDEGHVIKYDGSIPSKYAFSKPVLKTHCIFNASQIVKYVYDKNGNKVVGKDCEFETIPAFKYERRCENPNNFTPLIVPEKIVKATGAVVVYDTQDVCAYVPSHDKIHMVRAENFKNTSSYYDTLLHELTHWTGHPDRLNREEARRYHESDKWKAKEELVAEIGGYLLAKECNIAHSPSQNNYAYVKSWMKDLQDEPESIFRACKKAEMASQYILDLYRKKENENKKEEGMSL